MIDRRRALQLLAGAATSLAAGACKRKEMPKVELFDEDGTPPETEAISALAPPWPPAERAVLSNDLLVHWLTEEGSPAAHIRVLLPTHGDKIAPGAAAVVAEAVAIEWRRWTARYGTTVDLAARVDRLEVAVHGPDLKFDAILAALGRVVALGDPAGLLERAQVTVAAGLPGGTDGDTLALTALVGLLSGRDPARERLTREFVEGLSADDLADAWRELLDPKRVMLAVHAGRPVREEAVARLAKVWTRGLLGGLGKGSEEAMTRLRPASAARDEAERGAPQGRLLRGASVAPIQLLETSPGDRGGTFLLLGRVLPLADPRERAVARLAQRLLQEELDARLTIVGDRGLFVVRTPIRKTAPKDDDDKGKEKRRDKDKDKEGPSDPRARNVAAFVDGYLEFIRARHSRNRLAQAAELWLGARMVQASLTGEDWTALWSESIDLAASDGEIAGALARDAQAMLAITPEELAEWSATWLDVAKGTPGWAWIAASSEPDIGPALAEIAAVEPLRAGD
ncbi:MAG: hypothetical protein R3A79_26045 [Nannocystaceae bacterium]